MFMLLHAECARCMLKMPEAFVPQTRFGTPENLYTSKRRMSDVKASPAPKLATLRCPKRARARYARRFNILKQGCKQFRANKIK